MCSRTRQAIALLLLLGPASLAGKLLTLDNQGPTPEGNSALPGNVTAILAAGDYERAGRRRMLNGPAYAVEVYRDGRKPTRCDGVVYLMPMTTNAEASTLLAHPGTLPVVDAFFVFQGRIVEAFPSYSHWLARFTGRITVRSPWACPAGVRGCSDSELHAPSDVAVEPSARLTRCDYPTGTHCRG
jgi:hypothetical protein